MGFNAQQGGNLLVRHPLEDGEPEHLSIAFGQFVDQLAHLAQGDSSHVFLRDVIGGQFGFVDAVERDHAVDFLVFLVLRCHIARYRHHPGLGLAVVAQFVEGGEDDYKRVVEHVTNGLLVGQIASAYAPHPMGVCHVQVAERLGIPLPAPFYQSADLHCEHDFSIYYVPHPSKRLHGMGVFL